MNAEMGMGISRTKKPPLDLRAAIDWANDNPESDVHAAFLEIIQLAKNGEIDYLRECPGCGNIFFAGRKDRSGCSLRCMNKIAKRKMALKAKGRK